MTAEPTTVTPDTAVREALGLMEDEEIGALPVAREGRLVGIFTEHDFLGIARVLLDREG